MEFVNLGSSTVAAVAYDAAQSTLAVRFANGSEYHYFGVPQDVYEGLLAASSAGAFFSTYVRRGGYPFQRVG